jgi:hypothetical protein
MDIKHVITASVGDREVSIWGVAHDDSGNFVITERVARYGYDKYGPDGNFRYGLSAFKALIADGWRLTAEIGGSFPEDALFVKVRQSDGSQVGRFAVFRQ